jgi:ABC-type uncharacterized transport system ATPase subunit
MLRIEDREWKMAILDPPFSILDLVNARLASEIFLSSPQKGCSAGIALFQMRWCLDGNN